ncbi:RagB/SusD family nutrient uptake outer membrane protein [Maribellus maritimus]|uniref:RagB/SusD family nutrient uptake outer membrane protein n=1 Tax=Maribellus maritimus TaxID=2870838 RepID=UPI001EEBC3B4|nr:RagB/SusD family nutrient uptake outer membrane protein [Maribellus maritimus]MCG6189169.1 RagB/SusD family nutrient uptake outer membrane protein [Maribellus maritimus]
MKTYNRIKNTLTSILLISLLLGISSCSDELEQYPKNQFDKENFWTNEANAMIGLTGVYRGNINYGTQVNPSDWWTYCGLVFFEHATDNAFDRRGKNANQNRLTNGTLLANNAVIRTYWQGSYIRIAIANDFLENIGRVEMDETTKNRMIAEARFIRACQYFYLSQFWGSVPLVKSTLTPDEANTVTKNPKSEIVNFVITEFSEAAVDLPRYKDMAASEFGRASKQAALAFLGRIYLSEGRYSDAATTYKQIIDFGDNIIDPDYASIFNTTNETSAENIFSVQYYEGLAGNALTQHALPANKGGWHIVNPLESLASQYDFTDGTTFSYDDPRFNSHNMAENRDPRFAATFLYDGCIFGGNVYDCHPDHNSSVDQLTYSKQATRTGYGLRKFFDENFSGDLGSGYGGNLPIIRYAEVLLSYLEAELEAGTPITQNLLDMTINQTRGRESVQMPPITETNPELLRPMLRKERRIELALEGIRYWDLLRWGILGETMQGDFWGASFPDAENTGSVEDPTGHNRWWVDNKAFRIGEDEVWPIPESETNINPGLLD